MLLLAWLQLKNVAQPSGQGVSSIGQLLHNLAHIPAYAILTFLMLKSFKNINLKAKLTAISIALTYGILMELCQSINSQRFASIGDVVLNSIGIIFVAFVYIPK